MRYFFIFEPHHSLRGGKGFILNLFILTANAVALFKYPFGFQPGITIVGILEFAAFLPRFRSKLPLWKLYSADQCCHANRFTGFARLPEIYRNLHGCHYSKSPAQACPFTFNFIYISLLRLWDKHNDFTGIDSTILKSSSGNSSPGCTGFFGTR
jgi:hypothetical protein